MHKTEGANNDNGRFTDGPPATTLESDLMNAVCDEIIYVIETAGITLKTAGTETGIQLREALLKTVPMPRGYIDGLIMSNAAGDTAHDIGISVGKCRDSGDADSILFNAAMTKQIDANWAEGTNLGGFPSGLGLAVDTWYYVFVIMSADGTKIDAGFDTNSVALNLLGDATDYSIYRRIGSVLTDGSSNIIGFYQRGNRFLWKSPPLDINNLALTANTDQLLTLSIPLGIKTEVFFNFTQVDSLDNRVIYFSSPDVDDENPTQATAPLGSGTVPEVTNEVNSSVGGQISDIISNVSSQIRVVTDENSNLYLATLGWIDLRGKDD